MNDYLLRTVRIFCGILGGTLRDIIAPRETLCCAKGLKSGPYGRSYGWLSFSWRVQYLMIPSTSTALSSATDAYD